MDKFLRILLLAALAGAVFALASCREGVSQKERLEMFISDMESGETPNPRRHFSGHPNAAKIDSNTFNSTHMAPNDNLHITGFSILAGDTFSLQFITNTSSPDAETASGSFYAEKSALSTDWYIRSITVPQGGGSGTQIIPDEL